MYSLDGHAATLNIRPDSLCRSLVLGQSSGREGRTYSLTAQRRQPAKYLIRTIIGQHPRSRLYTLSSQGLPVSGSAELGSRTP